MSLTTYLGKYLGVPLNHGRKKKEHFKGIIDKIATRLGGWKTKFLSFMGRATLIQSVTTSIPNYTVQTNLLPAFVDKEIDRLNTNFLWGSVDETKKLRELTEQDKDLKISGVLSEEGNWDVEYLNYMLPTDVVQVILAISIPKTTLIADKPVWGLNNSRKFSTKSAYQKICRNAAPTSGSGS
ncbi:hypothetical protein ACH5RR_004218 [Cinchona calisaya]|uniref:Uncharacterized protein n=1 Tax=Cinchona calisaya TaxID=153742 RepID=A0ABD3AX06_9GENT